MFPYLAPKPALRPLPLAPLWHTWRGVPTKTQRRSWFHSGPQKMNQPQGFRTGNPNHTTPRRGRLAVLGTASLLGAVAGYFIASKYGAATKAVSTDAHTPQFGSPEDFRMAIEELQAAFPGEQGAISTDRGELYTHGFSILDHLPGVSHSVIVYPRTTADVVRIVNIATKYRMPITPYAGATSVEGQFRGHPLGGICVDMCEMNRILEIHEADSDLVCQPGVGWVEINETLHEKGIPLFFPIDPGPGATIGGMMSTACSGTNAVRYGTARGEWFLNATVVLPSGEVIKTRRRSRKSSAGLDVTKLFIGAEGTLGIITEVTIRLAPVLPTTVAAVHFPDVNKATEAVLEIMNKGVGIQCIELLDANFLQATNRHGVSSYKWPEKDSLFFKFQGPTPASLRETGNIVEAITERYGGFGFRLAASQQEAEEIWSDRKNGHYAGLALVEGAKGWSTDVCVPVSKLPELVYETKRDLVNSGIVHLVVGHVGDGNFHTLLLFKTDEEFKAVEEAVDRMMKRAIALDGTCTGEHGVGLGKKQYLVEELGGGTVELMKAIKKTIDPLGLFNPGKLYPDEITQGKSTIEAE